MGPEILYDTELIYSRVIGLQASTREVNIKDVLSYELSPIPVALFDESGLCSCYFVHFASINVSGTLFQQW